MVLVSRGIRDVQPSDVGGRRGGAAPWGFWSAGGGTAGTGKVNPALLPEGGQVAVNGTTDATTGNVTELAYINGTVWQENGLNLWRGKTSPTASWSPADGCRCGS